MILTILYGHNIGFGCDICHTMCTVCPQGSFQRDGQENGWQMESPLPGDVSETESGSFHIYVHLACK